MRKILLLIHIAVALGLLATGYAPYLSPVTYGIVSLAGYAFPLFLVLTFMSVVLAVFTCKRHLLIPFLSLILAYSPVTLYVPFHKEQQVPEGAVKFISYNTHIWGNGTEDSYTGENSDGGLAIVNYLADSNADIICLQESPLSGKAMPHIDSILKQAYQHYDTVTCPNTTAQLTIFSKFPIKRKQPIDYNSKGNGSAAFWLDINGREVIVVNNHLQTMGLSLEERNRFSDMVHGKNDTIKDISKNIVRKLLEATRTRAPQAEAVADFIRKHRYGSDSNPLIVCGDFNDIPHSYVYRVISEGLTDCYKATAMGLGFSFSHYGMRVRIDNVLCSMDITPYNFHIDQSISASDHYPMIGWLLVK